MSEIKIDWWNLYWNDSEMPFGGNHLIADEFTSICEWAAKIAVAAERERIRNAIMGIEDFESVVSSDGYYTETDRILHLSDIMNAINQENPNE